MQNMSSASHLHFHLDGVYDYVESMLDVIVQHAPIERARL